MQPPRSWIVAALFFATSGAAGAQQPGPRALDVQDVLGLTQFADRTQIELSPDGRRLAFTLREPRRVPGGTDNAYFDSAGVPRFQQGTDIHIVDMATGAVRRVTHSRGSSWGAVWSPDNRYLAFYSDRDGAVRVWLWDSEIDSLRRLSAAVARPYWGFEQLQFSPDGRHILVKLTPEDMSPADLERLLPATPAASAVRATQTPAMTARVYTHPPGVTPAGRPMTPAAIDLDATRSSFNAQLGDLAVVDVTTGTVRRVARRVRAMGYRFSPGGDYIAFTTRQPDAGGGRLVYDRYDFWMADLAGAAPRSLAPALVQEWGLGFSWSPDGQRIAYMNGDDVTIARSSDGATVHTFARENLPLSHDVRPPLWLDSETLLVAARDTLWRLSLATGTVTSLAAPSWGQLLDMVAPAAEQWVAGRAVTIAVRDPATKRIGFQRVDLITGQVSALFGADLALGSEFPYLVTRSRGSDIVAFVAETGALPPDIWVADADFIRVRRLTDLHPAVSRLALGSSRLLEWQDSLGRHRQGVLLLPPGHEPGMLHPLVVKVYGGSTRSDQLNRFGVEPGVDNLHILASRGYAVLVPDAPARVGTPLADIAAAVRDGVDAAIRAGVVDPGRLAVMGHSYGGYSALGVATMLPRFRAVISSGGFSNLFSEYARMREDGTAVATGWAERGQGRMGGHPWEHFERYRINSPFFFLDRVTAPVLLLHGGSDPVVQPQAAIEAFVALRRLGKQVTLVMYDGEPHHPGDWGPASVADYWARIIEWLERHL